jgi:hypothetical protein
MLLLDRGWFCPQITLFRQPGVLAQLLASQKGQGPFLHGECRWNIETFVNSSLVAMSPPARRAMTSGAQPIEENLICLSSVEELVFVASEENKAERQRVIVSIICPIYKKSYSMQRSTEYPSSNRYT